MLLKYKRDIKEPYTFIIYLALRYKHYVRHYPSLLLKLFYNILVQKRKIVKISGKMQIESYQMKYNMDSWK